MGIITAGTEENLFPGTAASNPDWCRDYQLYNFLFYPNRGANLYPAEPGLALSAEPNANATSWVFKLRDGVEWHNGKSFTADDVIYNFKNLWSSASLNYSSAYLQGVVDYANIKKLDKLSIQVPLLVPLAQFPSILAYFNFGVLPEGATPHSTGSNPIGTGPFKFKSFSPGKESVFVANRNYWETGKPYVDTLVVNSSFTDNNSLLNAMLGGEVNLIASPALTQAREQLSSGQVQVLESPTAGTGNMFGMRVDKAPFNDNRVREAFKLLVDRKVMIEAALSGFGSVGNDLLGPLTQYFAGDLQPKYDPDKARSLLKAAGLDGQTIAWPTANALPGMVESATILAQQATQVGVKINIKQEAPGAYWTAASGAYTRVTSQNVTQPCVSLTVQYRGNIILGCPYADTHWGAQEPGGKAANALILAAMSAVGSTKAEHLWQEVQRQQVEQGGYIVWANTPYVDLAAKNVRGLSASAGFNFGNWRLCDGWLA